tara:strand:- start:2496 stop:2888 length:393 start_codon:yes stop_codon:yes gene_type:complete
MADITAKIGKDADGPSCTVKFDLAESLDDAAKKWGEDVALSRINAAITIDVQAVIRRGLTPNDDGEISNPAQIQKMVDDFTPGVKKQGKSKAEKAEEAFGNLSDDEREELFKKFNPGAAAAGGKGKSSRR